MLNEAATAASLSKQYEVGQRDRRASCGQPNNDGYLKTIVGKRWSAAGAIDRACRNLQELAG
jgi:hypothetical protein